VDGEAPIRVVLVEDEGLYREMLATCLAGEPDLEVAGSFESADQALRAIDEIEPDVAILDFELPGSLHGIDLGLALRRRLPRIGIVLLSNHAVPHLLSTLPAEAVPGWAYMVKKSVADVATLTRAIRAAAAGIVAIDSNLIGAMRPRAGSRLEALSARQREILEMLAQGFSNAAIGDAVKATELSIAEEVSGLFDDLGIDRADRAVAPRVRAVLAYLQETRIRWTSPGTDLPATG